MDQSKITLDTAPKMLDPRKELDKLKLGDLAADVLQMSINKLLVNLRFLDAAMNRLRPVPGRFRIFGIVTSQHA